MGLSRWLGRGALVSAEAPLVHRARAGDAGALAELYRRHAPRLHASVLMPRLGQRALADDALSETFRRLLEHLPGWEDQGRGLWPLLATIATNVAHDVHRREARSGRALASYAHLVALVRPETPDAEVSAAEEQRALTEAVQRTLRDLPPRYREVLSLRFFDELGREAAAARLGITVGNLDVLTFRALKKFREAWVEQQADRSET